MKEIKITEDEKGVGISVKGVNPIEAMSFLTIAMTSVLKQIQPPKKENIIKPNINQAMGINKSRVH